MKITIDQEACISCGICMDVCGKVFGADEEGKVIITKKFRGDSLEEGEVGEELRTCVEDAANACPARAINIEG
ncbi:MAG: ferredoxin [Candidatus Aenigmarchaeota archaeon]|nr:ferredoxin [Candidatus Aenigmarchaeota archaeon]